MPSGPPLLRARYRIPGAVLFLVLDVAVVGVLPVPETVTLALRSAVAPGLGLFPGHVLMGGVLFVLALATTWWWFRWGLTIPAFAVWWIGIVLTVRMAPGPGHSHSAFAMGFVESRPPVLATHEFTWLMAVYVLLYWVGSLFRRVPFVDRLVLRRERRRPAGEEALRYLSLSERARAVAIWELSRGAGGQAPERSRLLEALGQPERDRGRRLRLFLSSGSLGTALHRANADVRAALKLTGADSVPRPAETGANRLAVPSSEPGWVQLLDGTLYAAAMDEADAAIGPQWSFVLDRWFAPRRGHRPEARHEFVGLTRGHAPPWQHSASLSIAAAKGWVDAPTEWQALRPQVLAAVGRGGRRPGIARRRGRAGDAGATQRGARR